MSSLDYPAAAGKNPLKIMVYDRDHEPSLFKLRRSAGMGTNRTLAKELADRRRGRFLIVAFPKLPHIAICANVDEVTELQEKLTERYVAAYRLPAEERPTGFLFLIDSTPELMKSVHLVMAELGAELERRSAGRRGSGASAFAFHASLA